MSLTKGLDHHLIISLVGLGVLLIGPGCAQTRLSDSAPNGQEQACNPIGAWEVYALTFTDPDGTVREIAIKNPPGLKILSETHWAFVEQNDAASDIPTSGGGGRYSVQGTTYTETVEYHAARDFIGKSLAFDCKTDDEFWYQSGPLPGGTYLEEVYRRAGQ